MSDSPLAVKLGVPDASLEPWALPPEAVIDGSPATAGAVLSQSADGRIVRGIWECTPGSFRWEWSYDETLVVISGSATVRFDDARRLTLRAGDFAFIARGQSGLWTTHTLLRKVFIGDSPTPMSF